MTVSRPEYRQLEIPEVARERPARSAIALTIRVLILAAIVFIAWAFWRGELKQGMVYAREWIGERIGVSRQAPGARSADLTGLLVHTAEPIDLRVTALVSGTLESASSATVLSAVEGEVAILSVVPEGTQVAAGDVVVELDSSSLRARLTEQQIAVENARAAFSQVEQANKIATSQAEGNLANARLVVEFARLDLEKYEKGDYPLELRGLQIETALAQEALERAKVQLRLSEDLAKDRYIHKGELDADRARVTQAEFKQENARARESTLQEYTYPRTKRDLESKVQEAERALARVETQEQLAAEQAEANLAAKKRTLELEESKLAKLIDQIDKCSVRAPQAGIVVYPVPPDTDMVEEFIKQGNRVKLRKHVFSIPDTDVLQVTTSVHEALVSRIHAGLPARIWVDSAQDVELKGSVQWVSPSPEAGDWRRTAVKFYETRVGIDGAAEGLRPGMSAKVEILIDEKPGALAVPVQSVVQRGSKGVCYVLGARPELRHLRLGKSSNEYVEVLEGLSVGDQVVLSPDLLGIPAGAFEEAAPPAVANGTQPAPSTGGGTEVAATGDATATAPDTGDPVATPAVQEFEYEAVLSGVAVDKAEAEFKIKIKEGVTTYKFQVEIEGGPPNATYEVKVDGEPVCSVTLDASGVCALELSTKFGNFPANFPLYAKDGTVVELGTDLRGSFVLQPN